MLQERWSFIPQLPTIKSIGSLGNYTGSALPNWMDGGMRVQSWKPLDFLIQQNGENVDFWDKIQGRKNELRWQKVGCHMGDKTMRISYTMRGAVKIFSPSYFWGIIWHPPV